MCVCVCVYTHKKYTATEFHLVPFMGVSIFIGLMYKNPVIFYMDFINYYNEKR